MYCYIYDEFVQDKKYEKELLLIENRLTDLGIAGKILRLSLFRNAEEMVRDEINRGATTVIVVGNDMTIRKVLDIVADSGVTFGLIPLGSENQLAKVLGVPNGVSACDVLSARIVEEIDMGTVNGRRFITSVYVPKFKAELTCDNSFRLKPERPSELDIFNLSDGVERDQHPDPRDGRLDAIIDVGVKKGWGVFGRSKAKRSFIPATTIAIRAEEPISVFADGEEIQGNRFDIGVEPKILKVITGKGRMF